MSSRIRVATYNVHKCRGLDRRTSPERIAAVIGELDADVVAIQEILNAQHGPAKYDQARSIHKCLGQYEWRFGENRTLQGGPYGNMTLSRLPVQFSKNYDLTWKHRERRGCLRTDVLLAPGMVLHIFNVHLGTSFFERRHQGRKLLSSEVLSRRDYRGARMIVGDFNEWTRGLVSRSMSDAFETINPRRFMRYSRTYPGILPVLNLDHLYYDKQLSLRSFRLHRSRTALIASDHLPLIAEFQIECE
ncbi:MAG TPA: endonuclease/exonuclease/phosphatase family protein [Terriglobales bacterium]|nr:endonuclease/exonuclease/phosphatase family protein [Terriglobales bacterium]